MRVCCCCKRIRSWTIVLFNYSVRNWRNFETTVSWRRFVARFVYLFENKKRLTIYVWFLKIISEHTLIFENLTLTFDTHTLSLSTLNNSKTAMLNRTIMSFFRKALFIKFQIFEIFTHSHHIMKKFTQKFITFMKFDRVSSLKSSNRENNSAMFTYDSFQDAYK